jgi:NAD(P)-dependent dehydrogenase (short-subunit alcohol dehydrogenase family)
MSLQGKRALVVGGETALGRAIAVGLAEAGADVAVASLSRDTKAEFAINSALNELWALGRRGAALAIDARSVVELRAAVARAEAELGGLDAAIAVGDVLALRAAMGERPVIELDEDIEPEQALRDVIARLE